MFKRGDLVKHKIGDAVWMVEEVKEQKAWPWSKPHMVVVVLHRVPAAGAARAFDYGTIGYYAPDELVPA